eukprot:TRINITY_DN710_c0_g1_i1.p1 TRINITY_DN710_c0_g1~~TRINITY_DN710_c0_g1_i1.p1  ORF type:complete len:460 (-),score=124.31 TRINITY_DN710_c0_g1_i1:84-1463(-)
MELKGLLGLTIAVVALLVSSGHCQLKLVIEMNRHGARGPIYEAVDHSSWEKMGELTPVGMRQLYLLGSELSKRYIEEKRLLEDVFDPNTIFVRSTASNRTIQSAVSLLMGLFPPGTGPELPESYPQERAVPPIKADFDYKDLGLDALENQFQPVPIHVSKLDMDYILRAWSDETCPSGKWRRAQALQSDDFKDIEATFKDIYPQAAKALGTNLKIPADKVDFVVCHMIMDTLLANKKSGRPDMIDTKSELWRRMRVMYNIAQLYLEFPTREDVNLFTTKTYHDILKFMEGTVTGQGPTKWVTYSAHDVNIDLIMTQLGLNSWKCHLERYKEGKFDQIPSCPNTAKFASTLIFELEQTGNDFFVTLRYEDEVYKIGGEEKIPYPKFKELLQKSMVADFEKECFVQREIQFVEQPASWNWTKISIIIGFAVLALILLIMVVMSSFKLKELQRENASIYRLI